MNESDQRIWTDQALDIVFAAMARNPHLRRRLIFKGGRVLNRRLGGMLRQSYDIDAALVAAFVQKFPSRIDQQRELQADIQLALETYLKSQPIVRFEIESVALQLNPREPHPLGWNAFETRIRLRDLSNSSVRKFPSLVLDVSAPEELGEHATAQLDVQGVSVTAYTLERIAGEKLRALLTSLPRYRAKLSRPGESVRAKDVYDIARIFAIQPLSQSDFWVAAALEFKLACQSRFVDCDGMRTFEDQVEVTRAAYTTDATIPNDIPFEEAWRSLTTIVDHFHQSGVVPFTFPLK